MQNVKENSDNTARVEFELMVKIAAVILLIFLNGCILKNTAENGKSSVEVLGSELIINQEPLGTHEQKYYLRLLLGNNSNDTVGIILSNFKPLFTIPNTTIKIPCETTENEIGFSIEKDNMRFPLLTMRGSELILNPNSETNLYFLFFSPLISDFDEEQMKEISSKGIIRYQSPCASIIKGYFSPNVKWEKEVIIRK